MIEVMVVGYGNIGKGVIKALSHVSDMRIGAIYTRRPIEVRKKVASIPVIGMGKKLHFPSKENKVAILCGGSGRDLPEQGPFFAGEINTVCSYDNHPKIGEYRRQVDLRARAGGNVAIISAGWDPGLFTMMRALFNAILPQGNVYTFWGKGVSQGHSNEARKVKGVLDARQYTIPIEAAMNAVREGKTPTFTAREMHKRVVFVVAEPEADLERIREEIVSIPGYYAPYNTEVHFISNEEMERDHSSFPHGGFVFGSGVTGDGNSQILEFRLNLQNNPEFTASILIACARAAIKMRREGKKGAFTMLDIPLSYLSPHEWETLLEKKLV